ncbi:uncharacterized protein TA10175 [Theileria annulata]|uniref:Uncharacterized protein n=1 Tax=Theileria annulata TaxID=5874 RepID=Q4U8U3_THEAN|nr:uncharacterized protein TA10175 [Theileria annulata]CAI76760.1 hypothetical protein, conserved [Theileria annulata]|eukprot:XP_953385.1 hypothetical protein, conserved [Theileria annulata]
MTFNGLLRTTRFLKTGQHFYIGNYRDFSLYEFAAPPRLQHVIVPVEKHVGIRSEKSPKCTSVFMHMEDPLAHLNGDDPYTPLVTVDDLTPAGKKLRGTGIHGPERTDVFRLVLFNRLRARQLQRLVPSTEESMADHKVLASSFWFTFSSFTVMFIMFNYGLDYALYHEHYPWTPPRTDGTRGPGPMYWYVV